MRIISATLVLAIAMVAEEVVTAAVAASSRHATAVASGCGPAARCVNVSVGMPLQGHAAVFL
jgi:hypothetical protein